MKNIYTCPITIEAELTLVVPSINTKPSALSKLLYRTRHDDVHPEGGFQLSQEMVDFIVSPTLVVASTVASATVFSATVPTVLSTAAFSLTVGPECWTVVICAKDVVTDVPSSIFSSLHVNLHVADS